MSKLFNHHQAIGTITAIFNSSYLVKCKTDRETLAELNGILSAENQLDNNTFQRFKSGAQAYLEMEPHQQELLPPGYQQLYAAMIDYNLRQKLYFYKAMMDAKGNDWKQYAKVLENRFPEFNLKKQTQKFLKESELERKLLKRDIDDAFSLFGKRKDG